MRDQLKKAIQLAKKTGDKVIVFESVESNDAYVIMPFEGYEDMVEAETNTRPLTEIELIDKINRDIAIWKSEQDLDNDYIFSYKNDPERTEKKVEQSSPEHISDLIKRKQKGGGWNIPKQRKDKASEIEE